MCYQGKRKKKKTLKSSSIRLQVESGHHRREKRQVIAVSLNQMGGLYKQAQWCGLQTIVRVVRTRHLWNKTTQEIIFYLSSLPPDAQKLGRTIRQHWSIENQLHWILDVTFEEDASRIRTGNAPENIALLKRWSINLLNQETSFKRSTRQKAMLITDSLLILIGDSCAVYHGYRFA